MIFSYGGEFKIFTKRKTRNQKLSNAKLEKIVSKEFANWFHQKVSLKIY